MYLLRLNLNQFCPLLYITGDLCTHHISLVTWHKAWWPRISVCACYLRSVPGRKFKSPPANCLSEGIFPTGGDVNRTQAALNELWRCVLLLAQVPLKFEPQHSPVSYCVHKHTRRRVSQQTPWLCRAAGLRGQAVWTAGGTEPADTMNHHVTHSTGW